MPDDLPDGVPVDPVPHPALIFHKKRHQKLPKSCTQREPNVAALQHIRTGKEGSSAAKSYAALRRWECAAFAAHSHLLLTPRRTTKKET